MKKLIFLIVLTLTSANYVYPQWEWIYPWPFGSEVISHSSYQANVWIIGEDGNILKSTDYGTNWIYQDGENIHNLRDVFFLNATNGWIGNLQGTILKTVDGGNNWQVYPNVIPYEIIDIFFKDELNGWASTYNGVYKSTDSGISWEFESNLPNTPFLSIQFINSTHGYVAGWNGQIYKTLNGGQSWINISTTSNFRVEQVFFITPDTGWISGGISNLYLDQAIYKTTNGGNTWDVQLNHVNQSDGVIYSICVSLDLGFASSLEGQIYKTTNGGNDWNIVYQSDPNLWSFYSNITILSSQIIFATGATVQAFSAPRILVSQNQGLNWTSLQKEFNLDVISGSYFFNQDEGLMCGYTYSPQFGGFIYKTNDGGNTWLPRFTTNHHIADIFFINNSVGWAGGLSLLVKTTNSGETWSDYSSQISGFLRSVFFLNENLGWVVGEYNNNFRTTDGGNSWISMSTGYNLEPKKVFFIDNQHGWVAGNYGYIRRTIDGGQNWLQIQNMPLINYNDIFFRDLNNGLLVADDGNIFTTTDGGETWQSIPSGTSFDINKLFYLDENNIWAVGYNGIILKSTDTGQSWGFNSSPNFRNLTSVFFTDYNYGWAFGTNGTILHTIDGGTPVELISYTAEAFESKVVLNWTTATETNNQGFEVQRKSVVGDFVAIGFVEGQGTTTEQQNYSFTDKSLSEGKYSYRLKQIDYDGSFEFSKTIEVEIHNPLKFSLSQNYPNPFNPSTKISWQSPVAGWQTLKVYDVLGNLVTTLVDEYKPAGSYEVEFKSTVGSHQLANGIYFYQLKAGSFVETKKMILLK